MIPLILRLQPSCHVERYRAVDLNWPLTQRSRIELTPAGEHQQAQRQGQQQEKQYHVDPPASRPQAAHLLRRPFRTSWSFPYSTLGGYSTA